MGGERVAGEGNWQKREGGLGGRKTKDYRLWYEEDRTMLYESYGGQKRRM